MTPRNPSLRCPSGTPGDAAADVEGTDDVERQGLVMDVGDGLEDAVVAELEVGGGQSRDRTPAARHERVDANRRDLTPESRALRGQVQARQRQDRDEAGDRDGPHLMTSERAIFR